MNRLKEIRIQGVSFNLQFIVMIVVSTLIAMIDYYGHTLTGEKAFDRFIFYFVVPLGIIVILFRQNPSAYGLKIGNWRVGLIFTMLGCVGMAIVIFFLARLPGIQHYYSERAPETLLKIFGYTGVEYIAWEFMWRGFLLFGLASLLGPGPAIWLAAVPFAFMHLGKPEVETLTTIFGGAAFGYVAWRSQSFIYPFLIHWFMICFMYLITTGRIG